MNILVNFFNKPVCRQPFKEEDVIPGLSKKFWDKLEPQLSNGYTDGTILMNKGNYNNYHSTELMDQVIININHRYLHEYSLQKLVSEPEYLSDFDVRYRFSFKINNPPEYK